MKSALPFFAATAAVVACAPAFADHSEPRSYVTPQAVYLDADDDRIGATGEFEAGYGLNLIFGTPVSEHFNIEARLFGQEVDVDGSNVSASFVGLGIDAMLINRRDGLQPFVTLGVGGLVSDVKGNGNDESNGGSPFAAAGLGVLLPVTDSGMSIRADARYRYVEDDNFSATDKTSGDVEIAIGLHIPVGGGEKSAPVAAPVVAPVVAPIAEPVAEVPADSDSDGVANNADNCPGTPAGTKVDSKGCKLAKVIVLDGVQFQLNSSALKPGSETVIADAIATLNNNPSVAVEVGGHTDSTGEASYNKWLSQRRAEQVRTLLMQGGIEGERITAVGYGEERPVQDNGTRAGREANRRVELTVQ